MAKDFTNRQGGGQKLNKFRRKVGAILIEFAFAIPVFLVLIYYIHDLPKQKLLQRKVQFVANEMAAILQNIATQKNGVAITKGDLVNAARLAWLAMRPGMTLYPPNDRWQYVPLGYLPIIRIYYVEGTGPNTARIRWLWRGHPGEDGRAIYRSISYTSEPLPGRTLIQSWSGKDSDIYPNLRISQAGEAKIIVECFLHNEPGMKFPSTGKSVDSISKRELFGFLFYNPTPRTERYSYFNAITIFTPQRGFSATPPK